MSFQTEFPFTLPRGYMDSAGKVHRQGVMRLATTLDEIDLLGDPRVTANDAYLTVLLLSRVIQHLGELPAVTAEVVGGMYVMDLLFLEDLYMRINSPESVLLGVICPQCNQHWQVQVAPLGGER